MKSIVNQSAAVEIITEFASYDFVKKRNKIENVKSHCFLNRMDRTVWKNNKFTLIEILFRQINYLVISKTVISQNFCQKLLE